MAETDIKLRTKWEDTPEFLTFRNKKGRVCKFKVVTQAEAESGWRGSGGRAGFLLNILDMKCPTCQVIPSHCLNYGEYFYCPKDSTCLIR